MAVDDVQIPPIRTNLSDPDVADQTAKEWYLFWRQSGDRINTLNGMVTFGNSADRLDPGDAPDGALFVEQDRSGIIYQNQDGEWHYIAGTMYGTISPDQRPSNLGANDAGFHFRSIDTDPLLGGHEWIWSGTAWIEVTANRYGAHANRLLQPLANTWNGMIWVEPDRGGVIYQNQSGVWHFLAGTMWGTISPDNRPTDLGANDAGFTYRGTDQARSFIWSGTAWIETTAPANTLQYAAATGGLTLTTAFQDIPGLSLSLTRNGRYLVIGTLFYTVAGADNGNYFYGQLVIGAGAAGQLMLFSPPATNAAVMQSQQWQVDIASVPVTVKMQSFKTAGTGTSSVGATHSTLSATWISP